MVESFHSNDIHFFSCCCDKHPDKDNFKEKEFILAHSLGVQSNMVEMYGWQELEVAGHTVPIKIGMMDASAQLISHFLFSPRIK